MTAATVLGGDAQLFGVLADWPLFEGGNRTRSIRFARPLSSIWVREFQQLGRWHALEEREMLDQKLQYIWGNKNF